ncbi:MAG: nucleotidyltransferase family protein [Pseudomonadales bacterium]|nr:nucleotidyltransferase family protein [Pseudomonadales bacterium]
MIGALILAAGQSKRFGKPKLSEPLKNGSTLIEKVLLKTAGIFDDTLVITRPSMKPLIVTLEQHNVRYSFIDDDMGLGDSIASGLQQVSQELDTKWDACVICLADMPFIESNTYQSIYNELKHSETNTTLVAPYLNSANNDKLKRGHPVGFGRDYFHALSQLSGDTGAQGLLKKHPEHLTLLPVDDPGILMDIDTQSDIERFNP